MINEKAIGLKNRMMESVEAPAKASKNGIAKNKSGRTHGAPLKFLNRYLVMLSIVPLDVAYPKKNVTRNILTKSLDENSATTPFTPRPVIVMPKTNARAIAISPALILSFLPPSTEKRIAARNNTTLKYII